MAPLIFLLVLASSAFAQEAPLPPDRNVFSGLGLGLGLPDLVTLDWIQSLNDKQGLRFYLAPPVPFKIKVAMPARDITAKSGVKIAQPEVDLHFKMLYGPALGVDGFMLPFPNGFFLAGGLGLRMIRIWGSAESPILLCPNIATPCAEQADALVTQTRIALKADLTTLSLTARASCGWLWVWSNGFFSQLSFAGLMFPLWHQRKLRIKAEIYSPVPEEEAIFREDLAAYTAAKEEELEDRGLTEIKKYDTRVLPVVGLSFGKTF